MKKVRIAIISLCILLIPLGIDAQISFPNIVDFVTTDGFCVVGKEECTTLCVDDNDWQGVKRAASDLVMDVERVTGRKLTLQSVNASHAIVIGTIGKSRLIDRLIYEKKLDVNDIRGQWESFVIETIDGQLIVAGSDKRGTIYGIYELSKQIGVSPWYWWADVPVQHHDYIYVNQGRYLQQSPKVKYRGIFINDEWPSFGNWANKHFGGINSKMYARLFELLLRLKANYLWPAMWASAFNEDDPESPRLADEYGIVMGTSHHEPMMRAHREYAKRREEVGAWNYAINKTKLDAFFKEGLQRNSKYENIVTIGMRGDGDVAMGKGDDIENMKILTDVIKGQRKIIKNIYGKADGVPQLWAIFTEVQRYYDAGFNVPDDVTLLFCDNNWGYIRRMAPKVKRSGGYGLYYHIDMNGGPWNDRWINTTPLPKLREQLNLAYQSGIDRIWIVNVGDLKPKELPIDFFLSYAWNPNDIQPGEEQTFVKEWAASIFGNEYADDVADILMKYPKYNLWRKPEVQATTIYSIENYGEADRMMSLWRSLEETCEMLHLRIPKEMHDTFYQIVYYPAIASANVAQIYLAAAQNQYYALKGDLRANAWADLAKSLFKKDSLLTAYYNTSMSKGKWNGMMQDKHLGYEQWSMPDEDKLPRLTYVAKKDYGEYAIESYRFSRNIPVDNVAWTFLPDLGRGEGCMGANDVTHSFEDNGYAPRLEYDIKITKKGTFRVAIGILPTQDIRPERGLRLGVKLGDGEMEVLDARRGLHDEFREYTIENLSRNKKLKQLPPPTNLALSGRGKEMRSEVFDNLRWLEVEFDEVEIGDTVLKMIMIDPEIVIERIIINPDDSIQSYFGPPSQ